MLAALVEKPEQHHWSSVHSNMARCEDSLVTPHIGFIEMGNTRLARAQAYRAWLEQGVSDDELIANRRHLQQERAFGSKRFQAMAEKTLGRPVSVRRPGRPRLAEAESEGIQLPPSRFRRFLFIPDNLPTFTNTGGVMRKQLLITGLCCGLAFALSPAVLAKTTDQPTDHQRIKALEARVAALEKRLGMPAASSPPASNPPASVTPAATPVARELPAPVAAPAAPSTPADWSRLHRGMSPREVTAQIGPPDHRQVRPMSEIWFYPDDLQLEFDRNGQLDNWSKP